MRYDLVKLALSLEQADAEYRRAQATGEQPRLMNAGTRYWMAKSRLFKAAREIQSDQRRGERLLKPLKPLLLVRHKVRKADV